MWNSKHEAAVDENAWSNAAQRSVVAAEQARQQDTKHAGLAAHSLFQHQAGMLSQGHSLSIIYNDGIISLDDPSILGDSDYSIYNSPRGFMHLGSTTSQPIAVHAIADTGINRPIYSWCPSWSFASREELDSHLDTNHPHCTWCNTARFESLVKLNEHFETAHPVCDTCYVRFLTPQERTKHKAAAHPKYDVSPRSAPSSGSKVYAHRRAKYPYCGPCGRMFFNDRELKLHERRKHALS